MPPTFMGIFTLMNLIGILYHPQKADTRQTAEQVSRWLDQRQMRHWVSPNSEEASDVAALAVTELLVVLGGDGSTLRAARLAAAYDIPIFSINMGRVGFLSEAELDNWPEKLDAVLGGNYWRERRLMLQAQLYHGSQVSEKMVALNDVVVGRGVQARIVHLKLFVDNDHVTTYVADGLIVATPTGSTAYSMAVGGPLLPPELENFLVIPVAPHLSLGRALVLHRQAVICIEVEMDQDVTVTADGQETSQLRGGDRVVLQKHEHAAVFARVGSSGYFYRRLMRRLGVQRTTD